MYALFVLLGCKTNIGKKAIQRLTIGEYYGNFG
jgi:hypothetical protein